MRYATGRAALGRCQRCGDRVRYLDLVGDQQVPGLLVCGACFDIKHPAEKPVKLDDGIALRRPSPDNDDDSVGDIEDITGTAADGGANYIDLASSASTIPGAYVNCTITLTGGTGSGQEKTIQAYNGSTKRATVLGDWATQPDSTTTYNIDVPLFAERLFGTEAFFGGST